MSNNETTDREAGLADDWRSYQHSDGQWKARLGPSGATFLGHDELVTLLADIVLLSRRDPE